MPDRPIITAKAALTKPVSSFVGGHLALDFCNTAGEHLSTHPDEMLLEWEPFVRWSVQSGLIAPESYFELARRPSPILKVIELREAVYRTGLAIARHQRVAKTDLLIIQKHAQAAKPPIAGTADNMRWRPHPQHASQQLRAILASEALSLFCSPRASRIGICDGGQCGWLFIDESRGKRRRWCDMKDCGNRAKARRHYQQSSNA